MFVSNRQLALNHRPESATPHPKHKPRGLKVVADPKATGEDDPLYSRRLDRDGWQLRQEWEVEYHGLPNFYRTVAPEIRARRRGGEVGAPAVVMSRRLDGLSYRETFGVVGVPGDIAPAILGAEWLDWDHTGRLVLLRDGRLWIADADRIGTTGFRELQDFRDDTPVARESPPEASVW